MGMIDHTLTQTGNLITTTKDAHGDQIQSASTPILCRFRYVTGIDKGENREALAGIDAIIWLKSDSGAVEGTIIQVDGKYWRIDRLIKARKLSGDTVEFLKAFVTAHKL